MWAVAVFDFRLTGEEFGRLTPGMFQALLDRRAGEFRRNLYLAGVVASSVLNSAALFPGQERDHWFTPWDFVPEVGGPEKDEKREQVKRNIANLFGMTAASASQEQAEKLRTRTIERLAADGWKDAAEIFAEVFPSWRDKQKAN